MSVRGFSDIQLYNPMIYYFTMEAYEKSRENNKVFNEYDKYLWSVW